eukprot:6199190-Pleurochrysis_carterae.AAC.2
MHTPFRQYPSDSPKNRYKVSSCVTNISRVTCRVTRHVFLSVVLTTVLLREYPAPHLPRLMLDRSQQTENFFSDN